MGACLGRIVEQDSGQKNHLIIDVQQIIADDAWKEFVTISPLRCKWCRRPKRSDYIVEVPMNYYHFEEIKQEVKNLRRFPSLRSGDVQSTSAPSGGPNLADEQGLKTYFRNDTDQDQTYSFKFQKTRTAAVEVTYQKGFSIGGNASFTLGLPQVLPGGELGGEINMNYEVTSSKGQKFEESVTTEASSEIQVSKKSNCVAKIVMEERRLLISFSVWVRMSMPEKQALVFIKNKEGRTVFMKVISNISMLFDKSCRLKDDKGQDREDAVQFVVHGVADGMQLANHTIHLKGRHIAPKITKGGGGATAAKTAKAGGSAEKLTDISDVDFSDF